MRATTPFASLTSAGDRIGRIAERHWERFCRLMVKGKYADVQERFASVVTRAPHPFANFAMVSDPSDLASAQAAMEKLLHCGAASALTFIGGVPAPVEELLLGQGFEPHPSMQAMAVDIARLAGTRLPDGYSFTRIGQGGLCAEWGACFAAGFEFPPILGEVFTPTNVGPDPAAGAQAQFFAVLRDGKPVSTSMLLLEDGVAGIYCVATLPEERGKGLGAHATAEPLRRARELGYNVGVLQATESGHPIYLRLGFQDVGEIPLYVKMPS